MAIATSTALIGAAVIGAAGTAVAASKQASAAKKAGAQQAKGAREAAARLAPFAGAGERALTEQEALLGLSPEGQAEALAALEASPGFQFRLGQGADVLERSAAARGGLFSGGTGQALTEFGQQFASNEFANRLAQLGVLSGRGQSAAAGVGAAGIEAGRSIARGTLGVGQATAEGIAGVGSQITGGIESALQAQRTNKLLEALSA